ncbi:MAG: MBOAT family O-acyltransferase, partial [Candidatus Aminicenantales bacterium]
MEFNSVAFLFLFLPVFLAVFWFLRPDARNGYYLLAGLVFYAWGEGERVFLLLAFIAVNYAIGTAVAGIGGRFSRKAVFLAGIVFDAAFLFYFKYAAFFLRTLGLAGGLSLPDPARLPLAVSFFTLSALSFLIDVYRRTVPFDPHPVRFGLFLSFFPKMTTGPITPYRTLAPALAESRRMDSADFAAGARRFVLGLAKKQLIADPMAATANSIFAVPASGLTAGLAWLGLIAYTLQIYFDFSSYTDMALGLGRMLGLRLPENFNYPYSSKSIQEFWKRWHMSLSQWLQYYLFLPIAYAVSRRIKGDRFLRVRADYWAYGCGAMVTFLLCGLWHGASWTFIAWGAYHGLFLVVEQAGLGKLLKKHLP